MLLRARCAAAAEAASRQPFSTSHCKVGGFTRCGATLLGPSLTIFTSSSKSRMLLVSISCLPAKLACKPWHIIIYIFEYLAYLAYTFTDRRTVSDDTVHNRLSKNGESSKKNVYLIHRGFLPLLTILFGIFLLSAPSKHKQYARIGKKADPPMTKD